MDRLKNRGFQFQPAPLSTFLPMDNLPIGPAERLPIDDFLALGGDVNTPDTPTQTNAPVRFSWPTQHRVVTSRYGDRILNGKPDFHSGVDLRARLGEPITAPPDGTVVGVYSNDLGGNQIKIEHADGSVTGYAHTLAAPNVRVGGFVAQGQIIGTSDGSGEGAPHLHFTFRSNRGAAKTNPLPYLPKGWIDVSKKKK